MHEPHKSFISIALRKAKIVYNFGLSECKRVKDVAMALSCAVERQR